MKKNQSKQKGKSHNSMRGSVNNVNKQAAVRFNVITSVLGAFIVVLGYVLLTSKELNQTNISSLSALMQLTMSLLFVMLGNNRKKAGERSKSYIYFGVAAFMLIAALFNFYVLLQAQGQ